MTLRTLNYGNYGIFLIMGNAGFCPSTVFGLPCAFQEFFFGAQTALGLRGLRVLAWRVGGLSNCLFLGLISTITPIRVPFRVLISLLTTCLLSPPTLQVGPESRHASTIRTRDQDGCMLTAGLNLRVLGDALWTI